MAERLARVDLVLEVRDARAVRSTASHQIAAMVHLQSLHDHLVWPGRGLLAGRRRPHNCNCRHHCCLYCHYVTTAFYCHHKEIEAVSAAAVKVKTEG